MATPLGNLALKRTLVAMHIVDDQLHPVQAPSELDSLSRSSFICHHCEKIFAARSTELYYFPESDLTYHRHGDDFYRALIVLANGAIQIAGIDSEEEDVLQRFKLALGSSPRVETAFEVEDLRAASRKFFQSMKRQNREISAVTFKLSLGD